MISQPKILLTTPSADYPSRNNSFYDCFYNLVLPEGSKRQRIISNDASANVNLAVDIAQTEGFTHIFFVDDDQMFHPRTCMNLLELGLDVVIGLYLMREFPFKPVVFNKVHDDNKQVHWHVLQGKPEIIEVQAMGLGGALIRTEVFSKLQKPYFGIRDGLGDDIQFSRALRNAGVKMFCDTNQILWHTIKGSVAPIWKGDHWVTCIRIGQHNIEIPSYSGVD